MTVEKTEKSTHVRHVSACRCKKVAGIETSGSVNSVCHGFTGGVTKHGGDVLQNPKVVAVYWGQYFASRPDVVASFDQFFQDLFAGSYCNSLSQYGVNTPSFVGSRTLYGTLHPGQGGVVAQIQSWLSRGGLPIALSASDAANWQVNDGRPFWVGRFNVANKDQVMFYFPGDGNWWLGTISANKLNWALVGNTGKPGTGFGNISKDPFYIGDFTGIGHSSVLFYSPGDFNWWLGTFNGNQMNWTLVGNTKGFGQVNDGRPFWVGRFNVANKDQVMFYFPGDGNWWLGTINANQLTWNLAGNTGVTVDYSADVAYAVTAFSAPLSGGVADNIVNNIAYCLSHELVEAFSNPRENGYYNDNGCEIGDLCEAGKTGGIITVTVGKWSVEKYWSNKDKACVSS